MTSPDAPTRVRRVIAPDGTTLTLADLPRYNGARWVPSRKAMVVSAVRGGLLTMAEACARYRLTADEFLGWQGQIDRAGLKGLRATRGRRRRGPAVTPPMADASVLVRLDALVREADRLVDELRDSRAEARRLREELLHRTRERASVNEQT